MFAIIGIAILVLVFLIVRNVNLPKILEQRRMAAEERAKRREDAALARDAARKAREDARKERQENRTPILPWRRRKENEKPPEQK